MNKEEIVKLALECVSEDYRDETFARGIIMLTLEELERFAKLVATAEREACRKIAKRQHLAYNWNERKGFPKGI